MNQGIDSSAVTRPAWPTRRSYFASSLQIRDRTFTWGERTYLMGIINVSPEIQNLFQSPAEDPMALMSRSPADESGQ